jgi:hypothetical protein
MKLDVFAPRICCNGHEVTAEVARLHVSTKNGRIYLECKACERDREAKRLENPQTKIHRRKLQRQFYARNRDRRQAKAFIRKYEITPAEKDQIFIMQGRACGNPGCRVTESDKWHTDHDHTTNIVRGVLCDHCNLALGHVHDNPKKAAGLARYLREREQG